MFAMFRNVPQCSPHSSQSAVPWPQVRPDEAVDLRAALDLVVRMPFETPAVGGHSVLRLGTHL